MISNSEVKRTLKTLYKVEFCFFEGDFRLNLRYVMVYILFHKIK
jgi:hypothetical protein